MENFFKTTNISKQTLANIYDSFELKKTSNTERFMLKDCEKLINSVKEISNSKERNKVINILNSIIKDFLNYETLTWISDKEFIEKLFLIRKEGFLHDEYNPYTEIAKATTRMSLLAENMKKEVCKDEKNHSDKKKQIDALIKEIEDRKYIDIIKNFNQIFKDYYTIEEIGLENYLQSAQAIKQTLNELNEIIALNNFNKLKKESKEYLENIKNIILEHYFNEENKNRFLDKALELEQKSDSEYDKKIVNFFKENFSNEYEEKIKIEKNTKMLLLPCLNRCDKEGYLKKLLEDIKTRGITLKLIEEMYCENKCYIDNEKQEKEAEMSKREKPGLFAKIFGTKNKVKKGKQKHLIEYSPEAVKKGCINEKIEKFFDKLKKEKLVNEFKINEDGKFIVEFKQQVLPDKNKEEIKAGAKKIIEEVQPKVNVSTTEKYSEDDFDKSKNTNSVEEKLVDEIKIGNNNKFMVEPEEQILSNKNKERIEIRTKKIVEKFQPKAKESFTERYLRNNESVKENKIEENESERGVKKLVKFFENKKEGEKRCSVRC